jgi:HEAT repeat protein
LVINRRWLSAVCLAAATVAVAPGWVRAQDAPAANTAEAAQLDLQRQEGVLNDRQATQQARDEVARRLASRATREANDILLRVLTSAANQGGQLAVARALATASAPDPIFIGPLGDLLGRGDLTDAAAQALANYKDNNEAVARLTNFVTGDVRITPQQRAAAVRAMGRMVDKRVAGTLIELLRNEPAGSVKGAAADALIEMTGLSNFGRDEQQWMRWWDANRAASDLDWAKNLLRKNNQEVREYKDRLESVQDTLRGLIAAEYTRTPVADRAKLMAGYLKSATEDVRLAAVRVLYFQATNFGPTAVADPLKETLRAMVGDSSTDVRREVAQTLTAVNDAGAVPALLAQLAQERDPSVRAAILTALGTASDLRAVPAILAALDDPSNTAAIAAATALNKQMTDQLRNPANADLYQKTADALRKRLDELTKIGISAQEPRTAIVEAMANLGHPSFTRIFAQLTNPSREPIQVRRAAYRGLKRIGDKDTINTITQGLHDLAPGVRLDAVDAMSIGSFEEARQALEPMLGTETDKSVRDKAWAVLSGLFPKASPEGLNGLAEVCKRLNQKDWRAAALTAAVDKLDQAGAAEKAALLRQNLGDTLLDLKRPQEAAVVLRKALDYWDSINAVQAVKEPVRNQLLVALIRAKKYPDAIGFVSDVVKQDQANEQGMWSNVRREIEDLRRARDWDSALALIAEAVKPTSALTDFHKSFLSKLQEEVTAEKNAGGSYWTRSEDQVLPSIGWEPWPLA